MPAMSNEEKLAALTEARAILSDPVNWNKGGYVVWTDGEAGVVTEEGTPAHASYCVMGAVAKAAFGYTDKELADDDESANNRLGECSLARTVFLALPQDRLDDLLEGYNENYWDENDGEYGAPRYDSIESLIENELTYDEMLETIYDFNDDAAREREEVIAVLDRAIEMLTPVEAK